MARLLSVNVGLPRDIAWRGKTVHTAVWKEPVQGRRMVRRLNLESDGQGDLQHHGGEHQGSIGRAKSETFPIPLITEACHHQFGVVGSCLASRRNL